MIERGRITRRAPMLCPWCGIISNAEADPMGQAKPKVGDACLCTACGGWQIYERDHMRKPDATEAQELAEDVLSQFVRLLWERSEQERTKQ